MNLINKYKAYFFLVLIFGSITFADNQIEGRWHLVGYEENIMYEFQNNLRYSIYSIDGIFGDIDEAGATPSPYYILDDIITIDLHFGNIVNYQMFFYCNYNIVEFIDIDSNILHSTMFKEDFNFNNNDCYANIENCYDLSSIDFGLCDMFLGSGWNGNECENFSGCGWVVEDIDYSDLFFESIDECQANCNQLNCQDGFVEINGLCFSEIDISIIQKMIDNSYESGIDLDCNGSPYCGSPNPYFDSEEFWGYLMYDDITYQFLGNNNGIVEPLELGIQKWEDGRLTDLDCGAYIYCQLSGPIPFEINYLTELKRFRVEGNYFDGYVPYTICDLEINYNDYIDFDLSYNRLCAPFPSCIDIDNNFWGQFDDECSDIGDINYDYSINILDIITMINYILENNNLDYQLLVVSDLNSDSILNILDIVLLTNIILGSN